MAFASLSLQRSGPTVRWWSLLPLLGVLGLVVVVDLATKTIPDLLTLPGIVYGLLLAFGAGGGPTLAQAGLGVLVGGGALLLLAVLSRGGIGGGDIKLVALLGAAIGWKGALIAFAVSQLLGGVVVLVLFLTGQGRRKKTLPIGAIIALVGALLLARSG